MKNQISYASIERKKYKRLHLWVLFLLYLFINCGVMGTTLFSKSFQSNMNTTGFSWNQILDSYFLFQVIFNPILLAVLSSKSVELENLGNMWKVLRICGVDYKTIYQKKFSTIFFRYGIYQFLCWGSIFIMTRFIGLKEPLPYLRLTVDFISQLSISFLLLSIHYLLALKWENQLVTISIALLGTVMGIISLFFPKIVSYFVPYSWYGQLTGIQYEYLSPEHFIMTENSINYIPLVLSLFFGVLLYTIGKKYFSEVKDS